MNSETANRIINLPTEVKEKVLRRLAALIVLKRELGQENLKERLNALPEDIQKELLKEIAVEIKLQEMLQRHKKNLEDEESSQTAEKEVPKSSLTPYHYERSRAAQKSIDEMAKNPLTIEQAKEQVERLKTPSASLTEYHFERSIAAKKAVEEMSKHPLTLEQKKEQAARLNNQSYKERYSDTQPPPIFDLDSL